VSRDKLWPLLSAATSKEHREMGVYMRDPQTGRKCKKGQKGVWYYYFTIKGRRYRSSIPEAQNKSQALAVEANARKAVFEGTYGRKESGRASFTEFILGEYMTWAKEKKKSWRFDHYIAPIAAKYFQGRRFCDVTVKEIETYRDARLSEITKRGSRRNGNSVVREMAMLSRVFELAIKKGYCEENPVRKADWPHRPNRRERFISDEEERKILEILTGRYEKLRPLFILALYSGMRRGELFSLRWSDVDFKNANLTIRAETTKTGKGRNIPLIEPAKSVMAALKKSLDGEPHEKVFPYGDKWTSALYREAFDKLGLTDVGLHTLRHTFATRCMKAGMHPFAVKDILGHSAINMTAYYSHTGREDLLREAKKLEKSVKMPL